MEHLSKYGVIWLEKSAHGRLGQYLSTLSYKTSVDHILDGLHLISPMVFFSCLTPNVTLDVIHHVSYQVTGGFFGRETHLK